MKPDWNSNVQPKRVVKPLPQAWLCFCPELRPAYLCNCLDCGARRPS